MNRSKSTLACTCLALATLAGTQASLAQCSLWKVMANDKQSGDAFGAAVSISRDAAGAAFPARMMVGAWGDDLDAGADAGSVYTFYQSNNQWVESTHIIAADAQAGDAFGSAVALDDPGAIVGASGVGTTGAAYIFERSGGTWVQKAKIIPSGSQANDEVGKSVAITGTHYAAIGIPGRDVHLGGGGPDSDPDAGVVSLVMKINGVWTVTQTLPTRPAVEAGLHAGERYGAGVAMSGNMIACGAPSAEIPGWPANHGYVDVYRSNSPAWTRTDRLTAIGPQADDHFGAAVATDWNYIVIGAPDDDVWDNQIPGVLAKSNSGSMTIFSWSGSEWVYDGQYYAQDPTDDARFGSSVSIRDGELVVGAVNAKKAYTFRRVGVSHWVQVAMIDDPDNSAGGSFARSVAVGAGQIAIGDRDDETGAMTNHGAVYAMPVTPDTRPIDACDATGAPAISGQGTYGGCTDSATLRGSSTCGSGGALGYGPDVYFSWTPRCSGLATIRTDDSDFDTVLSVHSGCPATAANTIVCNDDAPGGQSGLMSLVTFNYTAGETYLIRVSGYNGASGNFYMVVTEPAAPSNDTCAGALSMGNGTAVFDTCTAASNPLVGQTCAIDGGDVMQDVWYRYTASCNGTVTADTCGSNFDTVMQVFSAGMTCPILNTFTLACNDDAGQGTCAGHFNTTTSRVQFESVAGQSYMIRVGGWDSPFAPGEAGHGYLNIACAPSCACDWNQSGQLSVQDIFDMLASYFSGIGDFNNSGATSVQDIFDFLACYFAGCA